MPCRWSSVWEPTHSKGNPWCDWVEGIGIRPRDPNQKWQWYLWLFTKWCPWSSVLEPTNSKRDTPGVDGSEIPQSMGPMKDEVRTMTTLLSCVVPDIVTKSTLGISQMILYQSPHDLPLLLCLLQVAHLTVHFFRFDGHDGRYWISAYQVQQPSAPTILWHPLSSQSLRRAVCRRKRLRIQKLHFAVKKRVKMSRLRSRSPTMSRIEVLSWLSEELQLPQ